MNYARNVVILRSGLCIYSHVMMKVETNQEISILVNLMGVNTKTIPQEHEIDLILVLHFLEG